MLALQAKNEKKVGKQERENGMEREREREKGRQGWRGQADTSTAEEDERCALAAGSRYVCTSRARRAFAWPARTVTITAEQNVAADLECKRVETAGQVVASIAVFSMACLTVCIHLKMV